MVTVNLPGINIIKRKLVSGQIREYHYAYRGGPVIWRSDWSYKIGSVEYLQAYRKAHDEPAGFCERVKRCLAEAETESPVDRYLREQTRRK